MRFSGNLKSEALIDVSQAYLKSSLSLFSWDSKLVRLGPLLDAAPLPSVPEPLCGHVLRRLPSWASSVSTDPCHPPLCHAL